MTMRNWHTKRRTRDVYQRFMLASERGPGVRVPAAEAHALSMDDAIMTVAGHHASDCPGDTGDAWHCSCMGGGTGE